MQRRNRGGNGNPWIWIIIGFFMLNAFSRFSGIMALMALGMIAIGALWLFSRANVPQSPPIDRERPDWRGDYDLRRPREMTETAARRSESRSPRAVADKAVLRAGNTLDTWMLDLDDVGVVAYHGDDSPDISRLDPIPPDASHLRPFVVIDLPYEKGRGTIRFELFDDEGEKRFEASNLYQLTRGRNFITTKTWLPLNENRSGGRWSLRVSIGDKPLAVHEFDVRAGYAGAMRSVIREDGEVDPWLIDRLSEEEATASGMSLDDLLADQAEVGEIEASNRLK
jgi:hypothetical protein